MKAQRTTMTPEVYLRMQASLRKWGSSSPAKALPAAKPDPNGPTLTSVASSSPVKATESVYHYVRSALPLSGVSVVGAGAGALCKGDPLLRGLNHRQNQQWRLSRMLYSSLRLRDEWSKPAPEDNGVVEQHEQQQADERGFISDLSFSPDCRYLVASSTAGEVFILHPSNGRTKLVIENAHSSPVSRVLSINPVQFVSGSTDCTIKLWDIRNPKTCLNTLVGHAKGIKSMDYCAEEEMLVTSSFDGQLRYWHLPHYQVERKEECDSEETAIFRNAILSCPNFSHAAMSSCSKKLVCANTHGVLFIVSNLSIRMLKHALHGKRFDDSFQTQLAWFKPNASANRQNRVHIITHDEYIPVDRAVVSKIGHIAFHPTLPLLLIRLNTLSKQSFASQTDEWLCVCNVQQNYAANDSLNLFAGKSFGSDIFEETLLYKSLERKFATFREKRPAFSECGRVMASPDKDGVRILAFSEQVDLPSPQLTKKSSSLGDIFGGDCFTGGTSELVLIGKVPRPVDTCMCCKFSPLNDFLLAMGDSNGNVSFIQPAII